MRRTPIAPHSVIHRALLTVAAGLSVSTIAADVTGPATRPASTTSRVATTAATTASTSAPASQAAAVPIRPEVEALIAKLSANEWNARQQAEDELVLLGEVAAPRLRQLAEHADNPEAHSRAQAALRRMDERRVSGQSVVTVHLHDVAPSVVFAELARQGHTEFGLWPAGLWSDRQWPKVSIDADRQPFWIAMQELCNKVGVQLQQMGNDRRLCLTQGGGNWMSGPTAISGPFLVVARTIYRSNSVDLTQPANVQHDFNVSFYVFPEPKLRILQTSYDVKLSEVTDEKGNSLAPSGAWSENLSNGSGFPLNLTARLSYPPNAGSKIAILKGSAHCVVQTRSELVEVPDIASVRNLSRTIAGRKLVIKQMRKQGEQYTVETMISRGSLTPQEWEQFRNPQGQIRLVDARGRSLTSRGWGGGGSDQQMEMNLEYGRDNYGGEDGKTGEPVKLIWEIPLESRDLSIPFQFTDLPLP